MPDIALVVAYRGGRAFHFGAVDTAEPVARYLHNLVMNVEANVREKSPRRYSIETDVEEDEYLIARLEDRDEEAALRSEIVNLDAMPQVGSRDVVDHKPVFYAIVVGSRPANRVAYLRKTNPMKVAKPGWGAFEFGDTLTRIENPVFVVEDTVDLILRPDVIEVLRPSVFESLFYELTGVETKIRGWVKSISRALPLETATATALTEACKKKARLRRRLQAIEERGHLRDVRVDEFRKELRRLGYDPRRFLTDGKIVTQQSDFGLLLQILNEDLFRGGLTDEEFAAERKTPINPAS